MKSKSISRTNSTLWKIPCLIQHDDSRDIVLIIGKNVDNTYNGIIVSVPKKFSIWNIGEFIAQRLTGFISSTAITV